MQFFKRTIPYKTQMVPIFYFIQKKCKCNLHAIKLTNGCTCGNLSRSSTLFLYNVTRTE